jgi:hypothetical protein
MLGTIFRVIEGAPQRNSAATNLVASQIVGLPASRDNAEANLSSISYAMLKERLRQLPGAA